MSNSSKTERVYIEIVKQVAGVTYTFAHETKETCEISLDFSVPDNKICVTRTVLTETMAFSLDFNAIVKIAMEYAVTHKIPYVDVL